MDFKRLARVFRRHPVEFAYAFGSRVSGRARDSSDLDLAAFFSPSLSRRERERLRLRVLGELCSAAGLERVDLVVLNDAGPLLAFRVTASGKVIFSRDELARVRFEARAMARYYDALPAASRSANRMIERTALRGILR